MSAQLSTQQPATCDNVVGFGVMMVTCKGHIASEETVFCEPSVNGLASEIAISPVSQFNNDGGTQQGSIDALMAVDVLHISVSFVREKKSKCPKQVNICTCAAQGIHMR